MKLAFGLRKLDRSVPIQSTARMTVIGCNFARDSDWRAEMEERDRPTPIPRKSQEVREGQQVVPNAKPLPTMKVDAPLPKAPLK